MELDVAEDSPQGGRFAQSAGLQIAGIDGYTPAKTNPKLLEPGFKVLHIPDFDFNSHCTTLKECLQIIKEWSDSNPTHLPFSLYLELKEANVLESTLGDIGMQLLNTLLNASTAPGPGVTIPVPEPTAATLIALQEEVLSVLGSESIITPDDVREMLSTIDASDYSATKLNELLLKPRPSSSLSNNNNNNNNNTTTCPWPPLSSMQGKILLPILLTKSARVANYNTIWPNAEGSIFWPVLQTFPVPNAVFKSAGIDNIGAVDETFTNKLAAIKEEVNSAVGGGYIVRARADADTVEARAGRTERRDALLLETGTHVVATDYVIPRVVGSSVKSVDSNANNGNGLTSPLSSSYVVSLPGCATGQCVNVDEAERSSIGGLISTEGGEVVVCEDDSSYFACLLSEHDYDNNSGGGSGDDDDSGSSDKIQGNPSSSLRWDSSLFNVVNAVVLIVFGMIL
jgi:hypothetical protein